MKHLLTISQDSEATYKEYDVAYYNDNNDKVFVKQYYETPFIEILTDSLYHDTSIIPLKAKKCGNIDGDIQWTFELLGTAESDTASISDGILRFSKHYEGGVKLTATAGSVTAEKTITIDCIETPTSVTYGVVQPSPRTVNWNATEAVITYTGQIIETFAFNPQTRVTNIGGLRQTVTIGTNPHVEPSYATGNEYVDLGLSSKLKWAKCSIGAMNEYEDGLYFQWGDVNGYVDASTEPTKVYTGSFKWNGVDVNWTVNQKGFQKAFDLAHYKYCEGSQNTLTKYCTSSSLGTEDKKSQLDAEDDAAIQNLRSQSGHENARMPKTGEYQTLKNETLWVWSPGGKVGVKKTDENGTETIDYVDYPTGYFVFKLKPQSQSDKGAMGTFSKDETTGNLNGFTATSGTVYYPGAHEKTEGNVTSIVDGDTHIFFPASGYASDTRVINRGSDGNYWSSSLYTSNSYYGLHLRFSSGVIEPQYCYYTRSCGCCVRSVSEK